MDQRVDSRRVLGGLGRRWWLILLLTLLGAGAGYAAAATMEPAYQATGSILVGRPFEAANPDKDYIEASQQLAQAYADVASRQPVLEGVVDDLSLSTTWTDLRDRMSADVPEDNPQLIVVTVEASSPGAAAEISNQILDRVVGLSPTQGQVDVEEIQSFVSSRLETLQRDIRNQQLRIDELEQALSVAAPKEIGDLQAQIDASQELLIQWQANYSGLLNFFGEQASPNQLQVLETSVSESTPVRPLVPLYTALAGGAGFFVGLAIAYALEFRREQRLSREFVAAGSAGGTESSRGEPAPPVPPAPTPRQISEGPDGETAQPAVSPKRSGSQERSRSSRPMQMTPGPYPR
jgi:capsular polysaccharide biosynthesis protein